MYILKILRNIFYKFLLQNLYIITKICLSHFKIILKPLCNIFIIIAKLNIYEKR